MLDLPAERLDDLEELSKVLDDPEEDTEDKEDDAAIDPGRKLTIYERIAKTLRERQRQILDRDLDVMLENFANNKKSGEIWAVSKLTQEVKRNTLKQDAL